MSDETYTKAHQIVGAVKAAVQAVEMISPLPNDRRTAELLDLAKATLQKATLAAWDYAGQCAPDRGGEHG